MTSSMNQKPVPDFEFENSSTDDSLDDSEDDGPDNGGGAENPIVTGNREFLTPMLRNGVDDVRKKLHPTLAHAKSLLSSGMQGAPKPNHDQDPMIYHYRDNIHDTITDVGQAYKNLKPHEDRNIERKDPSSTLAQAKKIISFGVGNILPTSEQNDSPQSYEDHLSKDHSSYENAVIFYGDATNQIVLCIAWFLLVLFMMEAGARKMKKRYRSDNWCNLWIN